MAESTPRERLQPALLNRLRDDAPDQRQESREQRVISQRQLRNAVIEDLGWLFNAINLASSQDLNACPLVAKSVLNFGLPDISGLAASGIDIPSLERTLRQVIWNYEPRLLHNSVRVKLSVDEGKFNRNAMSFDIEAQLWGEPMPLHLYMKTEVDLDLGTARVFEASGRD